MLRLSDKVSPAPQQELIRAMRSLLEEVATEVSILDGDRAGPRYCMDWDGVVGHPALVVRPRTPQALARTVAVLGAAGLRMVPQGGLTGLAGGAVPRQDEVVVSTELLNAIEWVDPVSGTMCVQAGVSLQAVQEAADAEGLLYPVDLGARGSCHIGGNIATNAGGNRVLQYGMTRASILGLEVVLADGTVFSRLGEVVKDNAGYDLKQWFIGSEGTLGVVTRAVLRLQPKPRERITAMLGCDTLDQVLQALVHARRLLGPSLTSFEVMWRDFFGFVTEELNIGRDPFGGAVAFYALIEISCFDPDPQRERARVEESLVLLAELVNTEHVVLAQSLKAAQEFWDVRDASGEVARALGEYLSFDISIPTRRLQEALQTIEARLLEEHPGARKVTYGHLGDGNLHLLVGCPAQRAKAVETVVYDVVSRMNGSVSAEHGIGVTRREVLRRYRPEAEVELMRRIKRTMDPRGLLSFGRVVQMHSTPD